MNRSFRPATDPSGLNHIPWPMESPKPNIALRSTGLGINSNLACHQSPSSAVRKDRLGRKSAAQALWSGPKKRQMKVDRVQISGFTAALDAA